MGYAPVAKIVDMGSGILTKVAFMIADLFLGKPVFLGYLYHRLESLG
jgi:hypothetical protein